MRIDIISGARPNFIKIAPIVDAIAYYSGLGANISYRLIHTGQHYDKEMSETFFTQLGIPEPHFNLGAGGGSQAEQTSAIMIGYERLLLEDGFSDLCLVVGDVTSTMACSIVAKKMNIKVAHVEAGIRSGDWTMPEEVNRVITDSITDYFFTTSHTANQNLVSQGVPSSSIFFVGNTMIDSLNKFRSKFQKPLFWDERKLEKGNYLLLTIHRPSNVDDQQRMKEYLEVILENSSDLQIVFPVHPRSAKVIAQLGINDERLFYTTPLGYLEFNYLAENAKIVITDSGGVTEETTVMGVPCITLRDNTERPETVTEGTNELAGTKPQSIKPFLVKLFSGEWKKGSVPELWDGQTSKRIIQALLSIFNHDDK
ncbi:non-hydrolyzing UDP-N-acetylglucosamine 2-epimerase [Flavobacterium sp.]|uniref:non-hydrolyzing UDP-N-acetylglucosamine 2-epimerase n=1 Tax=Flavobacterium sp. TaxID=239 RepID=UPI0028BEA60C|nr:UDP-N-acetylglucosamine 2-epimerase (non-hydrolyzing) [Flavobacterium sp.]